MHNGMVRMEGEKMAKSVGNIRLLHGALDEFGRDALVMYFSGGHYRQPLAFSAERLAEASARVDRLREAARRVTPGSASPADLEPLRDRFLDALADDFNTPRALAALFDWVREANRREEPVGDEHLVEMLTLLGLETLIGGDPEGLAPDADALDLLERARARARGTRLRDRRSAPGRARRARLGGPRRPRRTRARPLGSMTDPTTPPSG